MNNSSFKVVFDCPLCDAHELQVQESDKNTVKQCLNCGFSTGEHLKGTVKENEDFLSMDSSITKWAKEADGYIWLPAILNTPLGIIYPIDAKPPVSSMHWAFAPVINIPEDEQKDYPIPNQEGKYYTTKYDIDNEVYFDNFATCILALENVNNMKKEVETKENNG